jgi:UDP-N-acetylglucosamine 1-carboxyvinyltransferase
MSSFKIEGGYELKGEIIPQGAKNEALQIICTSILAKKVTIENCPNILDVSNLLKILEAAGATVTWHEKENKSLGSNTVVIDNTNLQESFFKSEEYFKSARKLRGSVMLMGALLSKYHYAYIVEVGGDRIGARPIDVHIDGFLKLGAEIEKDGELEKIYFNNKKDSREIFLDEPSVTGTTNIILASINNLKNIKISNAACEPYVVQTIKFLENCDTKFSGVGSNILEINCENFKEVDNITHVVLPDFVEVGSLISLAIATKSEIKIKNCDIRNLYKILQVFESLGGEFEIQNDDVLVKKKSVYEVKTRRDGGIITIYDQPWPMFSPDLISVAIVAAVNNKGVALFRQGMFESRLFFVDNLIKMGAKIILCDPHRVVVSGLNGEHVLHKIKAPSPDIRAGVALIIAALSAKGTSCIDNAEEVDRGYENLCERLTLLGAKIERI